MLSTGRIKALPLFYRWDVFGAPAPRPPSGRRSMNSICSSHLCNLPATPTPAPSLAGILRQQRSEFSISVSNGGKPNPAASKKS
jgi:hypothetical protein